MHVRTRVLPASARYARNPPSGYSAIGFAIFSTPFSLSAISSSSLWICFFSPSFSPLTGSGDPTRVGPSYSHDSIKERGREGAGVVAAEEKGEGSLDGARVSIESNESDEVYSGGRAELAVAGESSWIVDAWVESEEKSRESMTELSIGLVSMEVLPSSAACEEIGDSALSGRREPDTRSGFSRCVSEVGFPSCKRHDVFFGNPNHHAVLI